MDVDISCGPSLTGRLAAVALSLGKVNLHAVDFHPATNFSFQLSPLPLGGKLITFTEKPSNASLTPN